MRHVPHVFVAGLDGETGTVDGATERHLTTVLRARAGDPISYTDGSGLLGTGIWSGSDVVRGEERQLPIPPEVTLAVACPKSKDRQRYLVEKLAELGVSRLVWLETRHGEGRPPPAAKARRWAEGALEQSRGVFLMAIAQARIADLSGPLVVADQTGEQPAHLCAPVTVLIGPEGGWAEGELDERWPRIHLSDRVLRTETAAVVAAAVLRLNA